jgi:Domain of unknown function (DUF4188)
MARSYVRHTAHIEVDFVVFLIGAYMAKPLRLFSIAKVARAMSRMVAELERRPELGYLGQQSWGRAHGHPGPLLAVAPAQRGGAVRR